jgi:hypothetical protein
VMQHGVGVVEKVALGDANSHKAQLAFLRLEIV